MGWGKKPNVSQNTLWPNFFVRLSFPRNSIPDVQDCNSFDTMMNVRFTEALLITIRYITTTEVSCFFRNSD